MFLLTARTFPCRADRLRAGPLISSAVKFATYGWEAAETLRRIYVAVRPIKVPLLFRLLGKQSVPSNRSPICG